MVVWLPLRGGPTEPCLAWGDRLAATALSGLVAGLVIRQLLVLAPLALPFSCLPLISSAKTAHRQGVNQDQPRRFSPKPVLANVLLCPSRQAWAFSKANQATAEHDCPRPPDNVKPETPHRDTTPGTA